MAFVFSFSHLTLYISNGLHLAGSVRSGMGSPSLDLTRSWWVYRKLATLLTDVSEKQTPQLWLQTCDIISMSESDTGVHFTDERPACSLVQIVRLTAWSEWGRSQTSTRSLFGLASCEMVVILVLTNPHSECFSLLYCSKNVSLPSIYKLLEIIYVPLLQANYNLLESIIHIL